MFPSGTGFKNIILKKYPQRKRKSLSILVYKKMRLIKVGSEDIWIWFATIELESKEILGISVSKEQNMFLLLLNDLFRML
jgi:hypothetical protein